jgi:RNA polymerase sigma-70 factor (ECF subfamily)
VRDIDAPKLEAEVGRIFREESGRSVAALIRVFGDIDVAEDAVQEAFAVALRKWPSDGLPPNPGGWITTTARNRAIDRLPREARGRELLGEVALLSPGNDDSGMPEEVGPVQDDRLRLIFTCCHPALATEAQVALTLRLLGGLSTQEVARSFLVAEPAMAQRLARAKRKIKAAARIPYRVPEGHELPDRLRPVLAVVYLVYNAGLSSPAEPGLCSEAIRLARILATLMPDEPEVGGLLALLLLTESRRASRTRPDGSLVLFGEQDRSRWDRALIEEGQAIVRRCLRRNQPGAGKADWGSAGLPFDGAQGSETRAGAHVRSDVPTCSPHDRLREVCERLDESGWDTCFVADEQGVVLGRIGRRAIHGREDVSAEQAMTLGPSTIRPSARLRDAVERMERQKLTNLPVTTFDGRLVGLLLREDAERGLADVGTP